MYCPNCGKKMKKDPLNERMGLDSSQMHDILGITIIASVVTLIVLLI
jgi:hypothetical protein